MYSSHGLGLAKGTGSRPSHDWNASLREPYFYGMGPLACTECHDPHGSSNVFHLRSEINGRTGLIASTLEGGDWQNNVEWCGACHVLSPSHEWRNQDSEGNAIGNCIECHAHGRNTGRRF
jgi:hypothetical protein